ncbi:hypothetical protein J6590_082537 [Homalodisca vitripennis]|nr:hypothetical protein J6590_082537 [Homalodisca vitripennis]
MPEGESQKYRPAIGREPRPSASSVAYSVEIPLHASRYVSPIVHGCRSTFLAPISLPILLHFYALRFSD